MREWRRRPPSVSCSLDEGGGSGLGPPIARAHGGDLTYEDAFVLRVPISLAAASYGASEANR